MTLYTVLKLAQRFHVNMATELVKVSKEASKVIGTSAELCEGDQLTVWDLLHGLMLPSGNDASHALAEHFGNLLIKDAKANPKTLFFGASIAKSISIYKTNKY